MEKGLSDLGTDHTWTRTAKNRNKLQMIKEKTKSYQILLCRRKLVKPDCSCICIPVVYLLKTSLYQPFRNR